MKFVKRFLESTIKAVISRQKSVLLLGARQTGKTTLLTRQLAIDLTYTFLDVTIRRQFETNPDKLIKEIQAYRQLNPDKKLPTVLIDEVQKVPQIIDTVQHAIDDRLAIFILTGSSARQLKKNPNGVNWLPGRVISLKMDGLSLLELKDQDIKLNDLMIDGSLPEIVMEKDNLFREQLLTSYVNTYLEEEVRAEALTRNLSSFSQFLRYAATEAGKPININKLSQEIGISRHIINEYYQILQDCLIVERIDALTNSHSRRRLGKAPKYLFFDSGVRRIAAGEGSRLPQRYYGELFEQFIGLELLKLLHLFIPQARLYYWKDHNGPEVDYVIEYQQQYLAIEVKYTQKPSQDDAKHLTAFRQEYDCLAAPVVICRVERPAVLVEDIIAMSWREAVRFIQQTLLKTKVR